MLMRRRMVVPVQLRSNHRKLSAKNDKPFWPSMHSMVSAEQKVYHYDTSKDSNFVELFIWCYVFNSWHFFFSFFLQAYRPMDRWIALWTHACMAKDPQLSLSISMIYNTILYFIVDVVALRCSPNATKQPLTLRDNYIHFYLAVVGIRVNHDSISMQAFS